MLSIGGGQLNGAQKDVIQELTLKKRQSKKSTMSERQLAARQQLARELIHLRKANFSSTINTSHSSAAILSSFGNCSSIGSHTNDYEEYDSYTNNQTPTSSSLYSSSQDTSSSYQSSACVGRVKSPARAVQLHRSLSGIEAATVAHSSAALFAASVSFNLHEDCPDQSESSAEQTVPPPPPTHSDAGQLEAAIKQVTPTSTPNTSTSTPALVHIRQLNQSLGSSGSSCCSFSRSDSSYSATSHASSSLSNSIALDDTTPSEQQQQVTRKHQAQVEARKKLATIKFNKIRLDHLNEELERRLHQYEYLVEQEKALLGTYNMALFTNEGVNNFHLQDPTTCVCLLNSSSFISPT